MNPFRHWVRQCVRGGMVVLILVTLPGQAHPQESERVAVRVDGRSVLRLGAREDETPQQRATRVEQKIAILLEQPQAIAPARVETSGEDRTHRIISVSGVPVVTVTPEDAQDNLTSTDHLAAQWAQAIDRALIRGRERRLSSGGQFVSEVRAAVENAFGRMTESLLRIIPRALAALLVIGLFWGLAISVRWLMRIIFQRFIADLTMENLLTQVGYYTVWVLGVLVAVDAFGFDPETVVTGLGLTSLALGFALKDILSNFVSGMVILTLRSFRLGDQIVIDDTEGNVERIELRATQIRTYDGRAVLVPNAELLTSRIINNTAGPVRRASISVVLGHDVPLAKVEQVLGQAMRNVSGVLETPTPSVRIRELTADGLQFEGRFWTDSRRSDYMATRSRVIEEIVHGMAAAEIRLAKPPERMLVPGQVAKWQSILHNDSSGGTAPDADRGSPP